MKNKITASIQILPLTNDQKVYQTVDKAIEVIKNSGLNYMVCPLETVIEGYYDEVMDIVKKAQEVCLDFGANSLLTLVKINAKASKDATIAEKLKKYPNQK
jgi:uncharacterized protein (TIGR00106 family)